MSQSEKSCVTRNKWQKLGVSLSANGPKDPGSVIPKPSEFFVQFTAAERTTSSATEATPWIVWTPAAKSILKVTSVWVRGSLANRT